MQPSSNRHSWEAGPAHSWEAPQEGDVGDWGSCSDSDLDAEAELRAGHEFVSVMIQHLMYSTLSAQQFCVLMWWASKAGITEAAPYALKPGSPSGHYSRKVQSALGWSKASEQLYEVDGPSHGKHDLSRTLRTVPTLPAHELVAQELTEDAAFRYALAERLAARDLPLAYYDHPVVREATPEPVAPLALYIDAVPYSQTDSVLGFWLVSLMSAKRYVFAVLRKRHACQCGCRGWCSFYQMFLVARWSIEALASGYFPERRHDGAPWRASDTHRARLNGQRMGMRSACIYVKGDWAECASTLGFPSWNDGLRPCFECSAFGAALYVALGNSLVGLRWGDSADDEYFDACERCEHRVHIATRAMLTYVAARLKYDKRLGGARGRALAHDVPELGLRMSDRLEPSVELRGVALFEDLQPPCAVVFWRHADESLARHRSPLFEANVGVAPRRSLTVDTLHCLYLGVINVWCKIAVWALLDSDVYGQVGGREEAALAATLALRASLMAW